MALLEIVYPLIMGVISLFVGALFLMISSKIFKTENNSYQTALEILLIPTIIATVMAIILNFVSQGTFSIILIILTFIINLILIIWFVTSGYRVGIGRAILILLVSGVLGIIPYLIIALVVGMIMTTLFVGFQAWQFLSFQSETSSQMIDQQQAQDIIPTSRSDCQTISDQYRKDSCYEKLAISKKDKSLCTDIQTDYIKDSCLQEIAKETGDVSICEVDLNKDSSCYYVVALKNNDGSLCSEVKDNYFRQLCFSNFQPTMDPKTIFTISNVNCGGDETSLDVTLNEDINLIEFRLGFDNPTQSFFTGASTTHFIDKSFNKGETKSYTVVYSDYGGFKGPAIAVRISFTTDTGDYSIGPLEC